MQEDAGERSLLDVRLLLQCARRVGDQWTACLFPSHLMCHRLLPVDSRERLLLTACSNKVPGRERGRQVLEFIGGKADVCLLESENPC